MPTRRFTLTEFATIPGLHIPVRLVRPLFPCGHNPIFLSLNKHYPPEKALDGFQAEPVRCEFAPSAPRRTGPWRMTSGEYDRKEVAMKRREVPGVGRAPARQLPHRSSQARQGRETHPGSIEAGLSPAGRDDETWHVRRYRPACAGSLCAGRGNRSRGEAAPWRPQRTPTKRSWRNCRKLPPTIRLDREQGKRAGGYMRG